MSGFFGCVSRNECVNEVFYGTDYHSHLGTKRAGMAFYTGTKFVRSIHSLENGYFRNKFEDDLPKFGESNMGMGIISDCESQPITITSHLGRYAVVSVARIDNLEELAQELLKALGCGATLGDVSGSAFDSECAFGKGLELSMKQDAIDKQMRLIEQIHKMGKEAIMSSHVLKFTPAETVLEIALEQQRRGVDVVKIVTAASSDEEQMENLRITALLKKELSVPFVFLSGGTHAKIHRMIGPQLGCLMYLAVKEHDSGSVPTQPTIKAAKAVRDNFDYLPDIIY